MVLNLSDETPVIFVENLWICMTKFITEFFLLQEYMYPSEMADHLKEESKSMDETAMDCHSATSTPTKKAKLNSSGNSNSTLDSEIEGQFSCEYCDKAFTKQSSLARHKYEHSGEDF